MPNWTAENELKLAKAIIAINQVKVSQSDCVRLAGIIGDGCTAKAITHRIGKFRESALKLDLTDVATTPPPSKKRGRKPRQTEEADADEPATPTKKPRTPKKKPHAAVVKEEPGSDHSGQEVEGADEDGGGDDEVEKKVKSEDCETEADSTAANAGED